MSTCLACAFGENDIDVNIFYTLYLEAFIR